MKPETTKKDGAFCTDPLNQKNIYTVSGRRFIVTPVYRDNDGENLNSILMRMMKADATPTL